MPYCGFSVLLVQMCAILWVYCPACSDVCHVVRFSVLLVQTSNLYDGVTGGFSVELIQKRGLCDEMTGGF